MLATAADYPGNTPADIEFGGCPLVVDLDGTLTPVDTLDECALGVLRKTPLQLLGLPYWLGQGKAVLKQQLANRVDFNPALLPYNQELLQWLRTQRESGRQLILCTGADMSIARAVAAHLGIFDDVAASDGRHNLSGKNKAEMLVRRFGKAGFDYAGNSEADRHVWQQARRAVTVHASPALQKRAAEACEIERNFSAPAATAGAWRGLFRIHQWLKNLLLFVPLLAAHQFANLAVWQSTVLAFAAFCLCASAAYITNDLLDLDSDRKHPRKRFRPLASGMIPARLAVALVPVMLATSFASSSAIGGAFLPWIATYFVLTCFYSWHLKRLALIDCLTLAVLYTLRIVAGTVASGTAFSFWLLAFSVFLFLSLAFVKRYAELQASVADTEEKTHGRGYYAGDAPLVQIQGIASGYAAILVLALYLNSNAIEHLYRMPEMMWGAVPIMLFWVSWMWLQAHRGNMHDDPLVFAVKDKASWFACLAFAVVMALGAVGWPW